MIAQSYLAQIFRALPSPALVLSPNSPNFSIIEVNDAYLQLKKLNRTQVIGKDLLSLFADNPSYDLSAWRDSLDQVLSQKTTNKAAPRQYEIICLHTAKVDIKYLEIDSIPILDESGKVVYIVRLITDFSHGITTINRLSELENLEKNILELNSNANSTIEHMLAQYLKGIELLFPQMQCSILKCKNNRLYNWSSPSMSEEYIANMQNLPIMDNMGSCGTAAFLKKNVIVGDIKNDPRWSNYKHIALQYGLNSCWSYPIMNSIGEVMAVLGMYYNEPKTPDKEESKVIERATSILKIILENKQKAEIIEEKNLLINQGQELAQFGNWSWDIQNNIVSWSNALYKIYGLNREEFRATYESYQSLLHPEDVQRVHQLITHALKTGKEIEFEERIKRPSGEIRHLKSWGKLKTDALGVPLEMIGACLDITESKKAEKALIISNQRYEYVNKATEDAIFDWNICSGEVQWGNGFFKLLELERNEKINSFSQWEQLVHPDEISEVRSSLLRSIQDPLQSKWVGEYRLRKADGNYAHVEGKGYIIRDENRKGVQMIGVLRNISEKLNYVSAIKEQNKKLLEIAWMQSHLVRAPLARIMGIIELITSQPENDEAELQQLLVHLLSSAIELDSTIKSISKKTEKMNLKN